jgi:L-rhamnose mutarotase
MSRRLAHVIELRPERAAEYEAAHAEVWPEVLALLSACNIRNYTIYRYGGLLFSYMEYVGDDLQADMARMAQDSTNQKWWEFVKPMQQPVSDAEPGEWWHQLPEIFHMA